MIRLVLALVALVPFIAFGLAEAAPLKLERVVVVMRHGVRPPTQANAELAKYAAQPWPDWPVAPGELTPHGAETVKLMGVSLARTYRAEGLIAPGCADAGKIVVWADNADQRTRRTGEVLAEALAPGCGVKAAWSGDKSRDPVFAGASAGACSVDRDRMRAIMASLPPGPPLGPAETRLQSILAPKACAGGPGACLANGSGAPGTGAMGGAFPMGASLAEDLLLEYADGKPMSEVGWGRASAADIVAVMPIHEVSFSRVRGNAYFASRAGAPMAHLLLAGLDGAPTQAGPAAGAATRILAFAGHDTNLVLMASLAGLKWSLPGEPDSTAPSTALAFELWSDGKGKYVRPVIYYETLEQLRALAPDRARALPLSFAGCASGPKGSCPLARLRERIEAALPPGC
jgi:4-phytase/acid phosphatase